MPREFYFKFLLSLSVLCILAPNTYAQFWKKKQNDHGNYSFHIDSKKGYYSMPFRVYSNLIVVPVTIDDSDTLNFILDTGVNSIFITDPNVAEKLGLQYVREVLISGAGEEKPLSALVSIDHLFKLGKIVGYRQNIVALSEDILQLSEFIGIPIHGIFGHSLFEHFVVTIDFNSLMLNIREPEKFHYKKRYGEKYPIVVTESKPYTEAISITEKDSSARKVRLVIDTGAGHALLLNSEEGHIQLPEKVIGANLGRGLNGEIFGNIGRVPKVSIGKLEMNDVIASFPDSISFSMKFPPNGESRQGSIGGEFLRRFNVTLNYKEGYMALKPSKRRLKQPFEHDMSGLDIRARQGDLSKFYVKEVLKDSPADLAGIKENDELIFINREPAFSYTITEIYRLLSKREGKVIDIFYRRNGVLGIASFILKRVI
jgi:predicted aspartyl protease